MSLATARAFAIWTVCGNLNQYHGGEWIVGWIVEVGWRYGGLKKDLILKSDVCVARILRFKVWGILVCGRIGVVMGKGIF